MKQHILRVFLTRRFVFRLTPERIIRTIDPEKFQDIHERHAIENPGSRWPKYLDLHHWIDRNLRRVRELEIDYGRRLDILDIGSGAGYFLYICKWLGHEAVGLDIDDVAMYPEMTRMLGVKRMVSRIEPFRPLPELGRQFDLITGYMICFNNLGRDDQWDAAEWDFFLNDLRRFLKPQGRVHLELNPQRDGKFMTPEMAAVFKNRGARIEEPHKVIFKSPPRGFAPIERAELAHSPAR